MWRSFASLLLRNKGVFTGVILLLTVFMTYETYKMELSYEFAKILPDDDSTYIAYQKFKKQFGEDGSVMVIGFADKDLFKYEKFKDWYELSNNLKKIKGVKEVLSLPLVYNVIKNDSLEKFEFKQVIQKGFSNQLELDSIKSIIQNLPFYEGLIYNEETGANLAAITFNKKDLDSKRRLEMVKEIKALGDAFTKKHQVDMHYSGMPYLRSQLMAKVSSETCRP